LVFFKIGNKYVYFHTVFFTQYHDFTIIDKLRKEFPDTFIQALNFDVIYNYEHLFEILRISNLAKKRNVMCSHKIELDFLLRVMGTNQISQAIKEGGVTLDQYITFVVLANKYQINKIYQKLVFLFGNSYDEVFTDKINLRKKIEIYKTKYNNDFFDEDNTIKFLTETAALVMK
jgi:tRNA threonylcarbamoyladenosine modification (KEOPS) complex Cgi121 subunit